MGDLRHSFDPVLFTQEEKEQLTARLRQAAEQEDNMKDSTKRAIRRTSHRLIIGVAVAAVLTMGALAAAVNQDWGGLFFYRTSNAPTVLEEGTQLIHETQTVGDWTVTLSKCMGDERTLYLWVDMKAPESFSISPPNEWADLDLDWSLTLEGSDREQKGGSGDSAFQWDEESRTLTFVTGWPTNECVAGQVVNITFEPLEWSGMNWETQEHFDQALWDGPVTFQQIPLTYASQTISLTPDLEIPYLNGTTTLTQLEISPFRAFARIEGGSCYRHHRSDTPQAEVEEGETIASENGDFTINIGGGISNYVYVGCWDALSVELHMEDGSVILTRTAVNSECQDGYDTPDGSYAGCSYVERRMMYGAYDLAHPENWVNATQVIDPSQVDYVTVCGVRIDMPQ